MPEPRPVVDARLTLMRAIRAVRNCPADPTAHAGLEAARTAYSEARAVAVLRQALVTVDGLPLAGPSLDRIAAALTTDVMVA